MATLQPRWRGENPRRMRPAVIKRKKSVGNRSGRGDVWLGRMLGVCETLRKRGQDAMGHLVEALTAHRAGLLVHLIPAPH